jgi:hypothetical protein
MLIFSIAVDPHTVVLNLTRLAPGEIQDLWGQWPVIDAESETVDKETVP